MATLGLFGERSLTLVAANFRNGKDAARAASALRRMMPAAEVDIVQPGEPDLARTMEPDQRGIWRTLLRTHLVLGVTGPVVGVAVALGLVWAGWAGAVSSPWLTGLFLATIGGFVGMMVAGLLTLRPDHARVIHHVRQAVRRGQWAVVAHPADQTQADEARAELETAGGEVMRSL